MSTQHAPSDCDGQYRRRKGGWAGGRAGLPIQTETDPLCCTRARDASVAASVGTAAAAVSLGAQIYDIGLYLAGGREGEGEREGEREREKNGGDQKRGHRARINQMDPSSLLPRPFAFLSLPLEIPYHNFLLNSSRIRGKREEEEEK